MAGASDFDRAAVPSVFTYGTLLFPEVMAALTGRAFPRREAALPGFRRFLVPGQVFPAIVSDPEASTAGVLYDDVDSPSLELLDRFEGNRYRRHAVTVVTAAGISVEAFAYVLDAARHAEITSDPWDPAEFAALHLAGYTAACRAFRAQSGG